MGFQWVETARQHTKEMWEGVLFSPRVWWMPLLRKIAAHQITASDLITITFPDNMRMKFLMTITRCCVLNTSKSGDDLPKKSKNEKTERRKGKTDEKEKKMEKTKEKLKNKNKDNQGGTKQYSPCFFRETSPAEGTPSTS